MESLKTSNLNSMKFKGSMKQHITDTNIVEWIVQKCKAIDNIEAIKYNVEFVVYVASCIEVACIENKIKSDKLEIFILVYDRLFEMTVQDKVVITQMLSFIHHNKLIKSLKYPIYNFLKKSVRSIIPAFLGL